MTFFSLIAVFHMCILFCIPRTYCAHFCQFLKQSTLLSIEAQFVVIIVSSGFLCMPNKIPLVVLIAILNFRTSSSVMYDCSPVCHHTQVNLTTTLAYQLDFFSSIRLYVFRTSTHRHIFYLFYFTSYPLSNKQR